MKYYEIIIKTNPSSEVINDVLCALAGDAGCESFVAVDQGLIAYAQVDLLDEDALRTSLDFFPIPDVEITLQVQEAENKDWNQEWEQNSFQPIVIGNQCVVHSTAHTEVPATTYDITINPRLAFGSGHHQTTSMMMQRLLNESVQGMQVLDMGCGTCILGILALMRGASHLVAIDIDEWSVENAQENLTLNNLYGAEVLLGDASLLHGYSFDLILANINRNILLTDMHRYVSCMHKGSMLFLSGFYTEDIPMLTARANELGLHHIDTLETDKWACIKLILE